MAHSSSSPAPSGRLTSIDALRALAALAVLIGHVPFMCDSRTAPAACLLAAALRLGRLGVPLFLVLSGFCIHLSVARRIAAGQGVRSDWGSFWKRRFWRLYPTYVAAILFSLLIYAVAGAEAFPPLERIKSLPFDLLTHLLLIHNLFADYCFGLGNGPFWSLGLEEQLYALYALFLFLRRRWPIGRVVCFALLVSLAWQCGWHLWMGTDDGGNLAGVGPAPLTLGRWLKWPIGLWFAWILGAIAAEAYAGAIVLPRWLARRRIAVLLALLGLATSHAALDFLSKHGLRAWPQAGHVESVLRLLSGLSDLSFSAAAFVLLNRWVRRESEGHFHGRFARALGGIGVISYSIYLIHVPLLRLLASRLPDGPGLGLWLLRLVVIVPVCLAAAALFFFLIERHFLAGFPAAPRERRTSGQAGFTPWLRGFKWMKRARKPSVPEPDDPEAITKRRFV